MRDIDPRARQLRTQYDDQVDAVLRLNSTRIAKARFAVEGTHSYPDATFTLRLSYGTIKGYEEAMANPSRPTPPSTEPSSTPPPTATAETSSCRRAGWTPRANSTSRRR